MNDAELKKVIDMAGGQLALARYLGISQAAISQWRRIPHLRVLEVEKLTGISRHVLRPDIFGPKDVA